MAIYKRGNKYTIQVRINVGTGYNPEYVRKYATADTHKEAKAIENELLYKVQNDLLEKGDKIRISDYLDSWLQRREKSVTKNTYSSYLNAVRRCQKIIKNKKINTYLNEFKGREAQAFMDGLYELGHKPATNKDTYTAIKSALDVAWKNELIRRNFIAIQDTPRLEAYKTPKHLNYDEQKAFLGLLEEMMNKYDFNNRWSKYKKTKGSKNFLYTQNHAYFNLALSTGMRRGELVALNWSDIDFDNATLDINKSWVRAKSGEEYMSSTKNKSPRTIFLTDKDLALLKSYKNYLAKIQLEFSLRFNKDIIFPSIETGEYTNPNDISKRFNYYRKELGLDITPHGLRHTHISNLLNIGVPLISVSNRAGHKNMETTARVYAGLIKPRDNSEHLNYMNQITDLQNQTS